MAKTAQASLFDSAPEADAVVVPMPTQRSDYSAKDIEVLEGLEPVRRRPGMYIGGIDERALHHLVAEVLDNAMDEAVAGHAKRIEVTLAPMAVTADNDDGRGMPVDPHPKFPGKSALEVILTTLHSGGKFSGKAYETAGGLHGVGVSRGQRAVAARRRRVAATATSGARTLRAEQPTTALQRTAAAATDGAPPSLSLPMPDIFGAELPSARRGSTAWRGRKPICSAGVEIRWRLRRPERQHDVPAEATFQFPGGLADHLANSLSDRETVTPQPFAGRRSSPGEAGAVEWAIAWPRGSARPTFCGLTATPCRRRKAAPTKRACAPR